MVCDLECLFPVSRGIFVSTESFCNVHSYTKLLICTLSRPLTVVLLSAFILMYHAFIAHIVRFLKIYDYLLLFLYVPREINHCCARNTYLISFVLSVTHIPSGFPVV